MIQKVLASLHEVEKSGFRLMTKFHHETGCGEDHAHWHECEMFCKAMGYDNWRHWRVMYGAVVSGDVSELEAYLAETK